MLLNNENVTIRTLTILKHLGVTNVEQLRVIQLPKVGEVVYYNPLAMIKIIYSNRVNQEILTILNS